MTGSAAPTVLLVCPVAEVGGAEQVTLAIARGLPAHGFRGVLATMRPGPLAAVARAQGIEAHEFPTDHRYRDVVPVVRGLIWLARLARQTGAALLHATHTAHLYAAPAARWLGLPEVWHLHDAPSPRPDLVERLNRRLPTTHAIFTTRHVAAGYPGLCRGPFSIIPPVCIDPDALLALSDAADVRARLALPDGDLLLTVTRLQPHKGHADLIDAAALVLQAHPRAVFVVVGKASGPEQVRYLADLRARADGLSVGDRVRFTGFVSDADLAALYRRATALVHPAHSEGYGLVLLEAMGVGLPVVAAAADGPREFVVDGENGLLVPVRAPTALAAAVGRLLGDPALRGRLVSGGRTTAAALTPDAMLRQTVEVFSTVVRDVRGRPGRRRP